MRVTIGGIRIYFEVFGQEHAIASEAASIDERPVVVALHGGPGADGGRLRFLLPQLSDVAQIIVPDQRGHGRSDIGTSETWNLRQWAADVKAFADALGIERPIVLGESFGGYVAQEYASTYPDHLSAAILVSCGPRLSRHEEIAAVAGPEVASVIRPRNTAERNDAAAKWPTVVQPLLSNQPDPVLDRLGALRNTTPDVTRHFEAEGMKFDLRPRLADVRCPTIVIVGQHDIVVPPPLGEELAEALPGGLGRLDVVADAAHLVLSDNPAVAFRLIREFVSRVGPVTAST
jgi:proline iminopeptidase